MPSLMSVTGRDLVGLLHRVDSAHLDCVSDDLALLLAQAGVHDVRTPFAADWELTLRDGHDLPAFALPPGDQDARLAWRTGYAPRWHDIGDDVVRQWEDALRENRAVLVVADAYDLPWVPYHRNEHMSHGFVIGGLDSGTAYVVDPYDNATPYGRAEPTATEVPPGDLLAMVAGGTWAVLVKAGTAHAVDVPGQLRANASAIVEAERGGVCARFLDGHRELAPEAVENLGLQTWLLARNRALHQLWLADTGDAELAGSFGDDVVRCWRRATEMAYVAMRRVRGGRAAPPSLLVAVENAFAQETAMARRILERIGGEPS